MTDKELNFYFWIIETSTIFWKVVFMLDINFLKTGFNTQSSTHNLQTFVWCLIWLKTNSWNSSIMLQISPIVMELEEKASSVPFYCRFFAIPEVNYQGRKAGISPLFGAVLLLRLPFVALSFGAKGWPSRPNALNFSREKQIVASGWPATSNLSSVMGLQVLSERCCKMDDRVFFRTAAQLRLICPKL